jgi:hypothetical protein
VEGVGGFRNLPNPSLLRREIAELKMALFICDGAWRRIPSPAPCLVLSRCPGTIEGAGQGESEGVLEVVV